MWKKKTTYLIIVLATILVGLILFINVVHIPYLNHVNELDAIQQSIIEKDQLNNIEVFQEYNTNATYYIIINNKRAYVYDEKQECIYKKSLKSLEIETVMNMEFDTGYLVTGEYGYENDRLIYLYKLETSSKVEYRYYSLENGQLIKMYILTK